jgi:peptide/nickel transport system substrate-binding protein
VLAPNYNTDFFMLGWTPGTYDAHNALYSLLGTRDGKRGEVNVSGYSNPIMDDLIDKIAVEIDKSKRDDMISQTIQMIQDNILVLPLHQQVIVWAAKKTVELVQPADNYFPYRYIRMK